ncbi:DUF4402 domain-containing protein [Thalassotalea profundi]|uniref:DUF4402 domain-containing protein n=1 Tax=Thalassotalea profundi TaxID=2036687 RepID=A0ABQ3J0M3_9GAMM|nr:DUF4402 domain-containing protein [Thalassotalea profundi]GHF00299.1 hypothetical protein GCM10011501_32280 [Thalassotalea profundi]
MKKFYPRLLIIICLIASSLCSAGNITQQQPLSFGIIALTDNNSTHKLHMSFAGDITADPAYIMIEYGHPAEFLLSDFPANTALNITILVPSVTTELAGQTDPSTSQFTIDQHHTFAPIVTTDLMGEATINVGATLTSSGTGFYKDAIYFSRMTIVIDY